jgi:hypothetical protein
MGKRRKPPRAVRIERITEQATGKMRIPQDERNPELTVSLTNQRDTNGTTQKLDTLWRSTPAWAMVSVVVGAILSQSSGVIVLIPLIVITWLVICVEFVRARLFEGLVRYAVDALFVVLLAVVFFGLWEFTPKAQPVASLDQQMDALAKRFPLLSRGDVASSKSAITSNAQRDRREGNGPDNLRFRTNELARDMVDFVYSREGPINQWKQEAMARELSDVLFPNSKGAQQFYVNLRARNAETQDLFIKYYWTPRLVPLESDLASAGVDLSPVSRAVALGGPRKVGLMLSVLAERIGKRPPYPRVLTPLEARAIIQGFGGVGMSIFAYQDDPNSKKIADILYTEFKAGGWSLSNAVSPLQPGQPMSHGIHLIFPSADLTVNFEGMILGFQACELDTVTEVRRATPPSAVHGPTLGIEVWPESK